MLVWCSLLLYLVGLDFQCDLCFSGFGWHGWLLICLWWVMLTVLCWFICFVCSAYACVVSLRCGVVWISFRVYR